MAASKLAIFSLFVALILIRIRADASVEPVIQSDGSDSSSLKVELDQLKDKIRLLESNVEEKSRELKAKDETIKQKEKIIVEKSDSIASLHTEISSLKGKGTSDAEVQVGKAQAQAFELQKQVDKLKSELEAKLKEKESLEARAIKAETKLAELNQKLENLQKINTEQRSKIAKTERALRTAEEELLKTKFEATSKAKELMEVHGAWLPPWLAVHLMQYQAFIQKHWNEHGKPAMAVLIQKAQERKASAEKWAEPHIKTIKNKWVPAIKDQWLVITTNAKPHVQSLTAKTLEAYKVSKSAITPHIIKVQVVVDPYFQEAKKFSKPYIDQVVTATKPHVEKVRLVMEPYAKETVNTCGKFLESATTYHHQVQASVRKKLKEHEVTRPLATKEFEWFAASALLALPVIILFRICSTVFCGKRAKKPARHANTHHGRRKAKRGHPDK